MPYACTVLYFTLQIRSNNVWVGDERTTGGGSGGNGEHQSQDCGDVGGSVKHLQLELLAEAQEDAEAYSSYCVLDQDRCFCNENKRLRSIRLLANL